MRGGLAIAIAIAGAACEPPLFGPPTEAVCPPTSTLTYENFGREFMEDYCTRCHAADLMGAARQGAPTFHDFDTRFGVKAVDEHIDLTTAAGPAATNESMPPDGPWPTLRERELLGEWIACGVP